MFVLTLTLFGDKIALAILSPKANGIMEILRPVYNFLTIHNSFASL